MSQQSFTGAELSILLHRGNLAEAPHKGQFYVSQFLGSDSAFNNGCAYLRVRFHNER